MKNFELLNKGGIIKNIPLTYEGRELPSKLQAKLMLMRVSYDKAINAFHNKMAEVSKGLMPEGFEELVKKYAQYEAIERKDNPTTEELEQARIYRETELDEYKEKEASLNEKYSEAYSQELQEEVAFNEKKFSEDEFASIIEMMKAEGEMDFMGSDGNTVKVRKIDFIGLIASLFTEE